MILLRLSLFTTLLLLFSVAGVQAQTAGRIAGRVANNTQDIAVTVSLLRAVDSSTVATLATKKDGAFVFENISTGRYMVLATATGYRKTYSNPVEVTAAQTVVQLPLLQLNAVAKSMAGITVITKKPLYEQKADRLVVNVEASITNAGSSALEVLEKSPGVTVDKDGNISLKGKEGVLVMVDGRPTQLGGADLAALLRNMNASQLDQVEIMTNPPAKYDAAGNAGIINIKTKKATTAGYNGSVNLNFSQGRYPKTGEGLVFNYRDGKFNLFANLSHNYRKGFGALSLQRKLRNNNTNELENYFDQQNDRMNEGTSYNGKIGLDYFAGKRTTVGASLSGFYNPTTSNIRNETKISTSSKELESVTRATVANNVRWTSGSANLNFRTVFDSAGKELTADLDYVAYDSRNEQFMINSYFNSTGGPLQKADTLNGKLPQRVTIYSGQLDFVKPLNSGARFEAGVKRSSVKTDNDARYDSLQYGAVVHDGYRSNHFLYEEAINAAYVNVNTPLSKKLSTQLGLRLENTEAKGQQLTTGQTFNRHYTQLFPTAYFQYKANEKNNFGLNYGRRLRRPNYESLNPFIRFMDRYTYSQGNPDLKPQFSHNIEFSHSYKNMLTTSINYTATNDIIQQVIEQKGREAYAKQANIASLRQYGVAVNFNKAITKWWTSNFSLNVFSNAFNG
ncbi:MAG TPA: TonB-dependent receptor, partial [Flavisolibacter sp.]|nr:TonB-dependent receptor [Flavisolibacter sp.]